jgi:hypothetical protein
MSVYFASLLAILPTIVLAIIVLVVGIILSYLISSLVRQVLRSTHLEDRIAGLINGGQNSNPENRQVENIAGSIVFWLLIFFTIVATLQVLNLNAVNGPFAPVLEFFPRLISAAILFAVAWLIATILRAVITRVLNASSMLRNATQTANVQPKNRITLGQTIGNLVYWLVFLLFLPAILGALQLNGILTPVQTMVNNILAYLPNILAAAVVFFIGYFVARIVRQIVTNLLSSAGVDRIGQRAGMGDMADQVSISSIIGWVAFVFILIPTIITALNALNIPAVSTPASNMLNTILLALPSIFAAVVILGVAYFIGRILGRVVAELLEAVHFNRIFQQIGLYNETGARQAQQRVSQAEQRAVSESTGQPAPQISMRSTPADLVGYLVTAGIMLFALLEASQFLGFTLLATIVSTFIVAVFQVLVGLVIFTIGLYLSSVASRAIRASGMSQANLLAPVARAVIIVFAAALGLRQMGIADSIVNLAFGLLLGAIAVAAAIAFGIGGRDFAHRQLERWEDVVNTNSMIPVTGDREEHEKQSEPGPGQGRHRMEPDQSGSTYSSPPENTPPTVP